MFTRVDDRLHDHPKFLKCSLSARGLWITALSWVGDKLTDGFVPHSCLGRLGARKRAYGSGANATASPGIGFMTLRTGTKLQPMLKCGNVLAKTGPGC